MPVIARFCGIVIRLLCVRCLGPRMHAFYGDSELVVHVPTLRVVQGDVPVRIRELVLLWARRHHRELLMDVDLLQRGQRPVAIAPLV
ncbi:MAG TPA: DUF4160 domain-containing protein [Verrucomicrobiota bacterium]|nr:DUF4160 domain-containing protein [Verrucomicrobiota bacterium]